MQSNPHNPWKLMPNTNTTGLNVANTLPIDIGDRLINTMTSNECVTN